MAVNAVAPFVLCSRLKPLLVPPTFPPPAASAAGSVPASLDSAYSHIVNVTALEGKFNVGKKSGGHPHTNMAKVRQSVSGSVSGWVRLTDEHPLWAA